TTLTTEIGTGVFIHIGNIGLRKPHALRLRIVDDSIHRKSIIAYSSPQVAKNARVMDDQYLSDLKTANDGLNFRSKDDKFAPYTSIEVMRRGRYIIIQGTLPKQKLSLIDLGVP
ncbi:MAG: hypothetical protein ABEI06_00620, partial [Halobacteriaceae archaeon]